MLTKAQLTNAEIEELEDLRNRIEGELTQRVNLPAASLQRESLKRADRW